MNFTLFLNKLQIYYQKNNINKVLPSIEFLTWFVGFFEGNNSSFLWFESNNMKFILVQNVVNKIILEKILYNLNLGYIKKKNNRIYKYIINNYEELALLIYLLNGNLVFPSKKTQFDDFLTVFAIRERGYGIVHLRNRNLPEFNNTWLLGFIESAGTFNVAFKEFSYQIRMFVGKKGISNLPILSKFLLVLKTGHIEGNHRKETYSYVVAGATNIPNIFKYFDKHLAHFQGPKKESYLNFKSLHFMIQEEFYIIPSFLKALKYGAAYVNSVAKNKKKKKKKKIKMYFAKHYNGYLNYRDYKFYKKNIRYYS